LQMDGGDPRPDCPGTRNAFFASHNSASGNFRVADHPGAIAWWLDPLL